MRSIKFHRVLKSGKLNRPYMGCISNRKAILNERNMMTDNAEFLRLTSLMLADLIDVVNHNSKSSGEMGKAVEKMVEDLLALNKT